ncbi:MltG/YceG/YrrL family protein [Thermotalea metallivorans]|nr:endolytic transglycosylase MltG [Thermotalea metallivorans]
MFEKIKDFFYESSDILLAFIIILVMSTVITWKVSDSLAFSKEKDTDNYAVAENQETLEDSQQAQDTSPQAFPENTDPSASVGSDQGSSAAPVVSERSPDSQAVVAAVAPQPSIVRIDIPSGASGTGIASILKQKGLIDNTAKFIARVQELKMESKLKSGTFSIPAGTSLDEIIYIITGAKR